MAIKTIKPGPGKPPKKMVTYTATTRKAVASDTVKPAVKPIVKKSAPKVQKYTPQDSAKYESLKMVPVGLKNKAMRKDTDYGDVGTEVPWKGNGQYKYLASKWNSMNDSLESNKYFQQKVGDKEKKSMRNVYKKLDVIPETIKKVSSLKKTAVKKK